LLDPLLKQLEDRGYKFVTVDQLLPVTAANDGP
jgi:hypothetical protein